MIRPGCGPGCGLRVLLWSVLAGGAFWLGRGSAGAQSADAGAGTAQDGSSLRAARLTLAQGTVTVKTPDTPEPVPAQMNLPLLGGVQLATGADGQAEVEFEDGSVLRLTPNSTLSLDRLSVDPSGVFTTAVSLVRGLAYAELRAAPQYHYTLTAGADVLSPVENATVRVSFDEPPAAFAVIDGTAEVSRKGGGESRQVHAGETLRESDGGYSISQGVGNESWDAWNSDRDNADAQESRADTGVRDGYAGAQGYGWADLDASGTWYDVPGQGQVWQPAQAVEDADFDPYGFGAWTWYPGAGYLWASGYPWGWTPYRCGSWNYFSSFGWGWSPAVACGGFGWSFWGAGSPVNIGIGPGGYKVPVVPRPRPGPVHPILPTRHEPVRPALTLAGQMGWGTLLQRGPREVNGVIAVPVEPREGTTGLLSGAAAGPAALVRDFPVDRNSQVEVTGRVSPEPRLVHTESGWERGAGTGTESYTGQSGAAVFRQRQQGAFWSGAGGAEDELRPSEVQPGAPRAEYVPPAGQGQPVGRGMYRPPAGMVQRPGYSPQMMTTPGYAPAPQAQRPYVQAPRYAPGPRAAPAPAARSPR